MMQKCIVSSLNFHFSHIQSLFFTPFTIQFVSSFFFSFVPGCPEKREKINRKKKEREREKVIG
jgi:hypothetical protein